MAVDPSSLEVLPWLKTLPVAPEYHPTLVEFQDPIAYILKIEQEASRYGICKIVPPLPAAPKSTIIDNLNSSFSARSSSGDPTFTTRQQQIGFCPRRPRPAQKSVWQSGSHYTLSQFEAKARRFEQTHFRKSRRKKPSSFSSPPPLVVESLFWKAAADKPFSVEYANDMPGSGFMPLREEGTATEAAENVGETAWNMRGVARAKGSLLRFMREEIPGVTSPMVYVAMMFSWFAWHVEDHDFHSLNYLHTGAGKTWYGVPRDASLAFEEVVTLHGYGGEVNPLITFATLAEKTTVMSPEVFVGSGIPCCRLVQNAGEFVVTFPGAYHSGFSHGFNCGEASNIATPGWLKGAKEAALRRASTNCPPMVSHYQLLYALALSLSLRDPTNIFSRPKSVRLKNKLRSVGETLIKETFVQNVIRDNSLLRTILSDSSSCVVLPQKTPGNPLCSSFHLNYHLKVKPRIALGFCGGSNMEENSNFDPLIDGRTQANYLSGCIQAEENSFSVYQRRKCFARRISTSESSEFNHSSSDRQNKEFEIYKFQTRGYLDQRLLSCVTCGILCYACVAVIQPREATVEYLMSASCNSFGNEVVGVEKSCEVENGASKKALDSNIDHNLGEKGKTHSATQPFDCNHDLFSDAKVENVASALDLLASAYGGLSESEEDACQELSACSNGSNLIHSLTCNLDKQSVCASENAYDYGLPMKEGKVYVSRSCKKGANDTCSSFSNLDHSCKMLPENSCTVSSFSPEWRNNSVECVFEEKAGLLVDNKSLTIEEKRTSSFIKPPDELLAPVASSGLGRTNEGDQSSISDMTIRKMESDSCGYNYPGSFNNPAITGNTGSTNFCNLDDSLKDSCMEVVHKASIGSSRMHVFCLEHAVEVEKRLRAIGGVNIMLLCHPDYPKFVSEAKLLAKELGHHHQWKDVQYRDASMEDQERIRRALQDEEAIPYNDDWTVKLGINLYFSVNLSKSPLFRKQLPYNEVIYKSFAKKSPEQLKSSGRTGGRQKKINFAGKWCGKVWMSNQVHPYLADINLEEDDDEVDRSSEPETYMENGIQEIQPRRNTSNSNAGVTGKWKNSTAKPIIRDAAYTRFDSSNDGRFAERSGCSGYEDDDLDAGQVSETDDFIIENRKEAIFSGRDPTNYNDAARRKSTKGKKSTIRSKTRKSAHTRRLNNSGDAGYAEEGSVYADDVQNNDQSSEGDTDLENEKKIIPCAKSLKTLNALATRKPGVKGKNAVRSSNWKPANTRLDNSSDAGCADDVEDIDQSSEGDASLVKEKRAILYNRRKRNMNDLGRWKSGEKRKNVVRSYTRKGSHTGLHNSSVAAYVEEDFRCGDNVQDIDQRSEDDTVLENNDKQETLSRTLKNNSARRKSGKRRKKTVRCRSRKPSHTRLDSSSDVNAEEISGCEGYTDSVQDIDKRFEDDVDQEKNVNVLDRAKSCRKRRKAIRSSTRKPADGAGSADDDHETSERSEADTDLENKKQAKRPRRNSTNKNTAVLRKPAKKRKRSSSTLRKKTARTSSKEAGYAEDDLSAKNGLKSTMERTKTEPLSMRPRRRCLNSGVTSLAMANEQHNMRKKMKETPDSALGKEEFTCNIDGCGMSFRTRHELVVHKRNICPEKGCGKKFFSHKYLLQHRKVHSDDRPLKCPWKGCKMNFKWAWARTEHIRVHTGERPYVCRDQGCGLTFRFVSDFSRHKRKTGHCSVTRYVE